MPLLAPAVTDLSIGQQQRVAVARALIGKLELIIADEPTSALDEGTTAGLTLLAIALSVAMLLGVEKVRRDARGAFANTISGTDLIVGARSGAIQLLLYSVFRIANATSNMSWESYRDIAGFPRVRWTVPISLGDSYRGFRVMRTTRAYFEHYRNARTESLAFATGGAFDDVFDAVLGAAAGVALLYVALLIGQPVVAREFGLHVPIAMPAPADWWIIAAVVRRALRPAAFPRPAPTGCRSPTAFR